MTFKAIGDSVIVQVPEVEKESQTDSGIFLIQKDPTAKKTVTAIVVSVGEGKFDSKTGVTVPPPVKIGDKIVMSLSTGVELEKGYRMVRIDDIFAVVE
jgi:co-chaperonin GroES (HSP10)